MQLKSAQRCLAGYFCWKPEAEQQNFSYTVLRKDKPDQCQICRVSTFMKGNLLIKCSTGNNLYHLLLVKIRQTVICNLLVEIMQTRALQLPETRTCIPLTDYCIKQLLNSVPRFRFSFLFQNSF